jgi:hypothetical protein
MEQKIITYAQFSIIIMLAICAVLLCSILSGLNQLNAIQGEQLQANRALNCHTFNDNQFDINECLDND